MASFVKFHQFLNALTEGQHNFGTHALKFALTNTAPTSTTDTVFDPVTSHAAPAAANGYTTGGYTATVASHAVSGGTWTLGCTSDAIVTATAGGIGPFRYVVLYNDGADTDPLIGYWDYGSSITLAAGETFTIDVTDSLFTLA